MSGPSTFMSKAMVPFFNMDKMIGEQFEQGLTALKAMTERNSA